MKKSTIVMMIAISLVLQMISPAGFSIDVFAANAKSTITDIENHWAKSLILELVREGIVKGSLGKEGKIYIHPEKSISKAEFLALVVRAFGVKMKQNAVKEFRDVQNTDWFKETLDIAYSNRLFDGFTDRTVRPNELVTRGYVSNVLTRVKGWEYAAEKKMVFPDVTPELWYYSSVMALWERDIVKGTAEGIFLGGNLITRAEAMAMIQKVRKYKETMPGDPKIGYRLSSVSRSLEQNERETRHTPVPKQITEASGAPTSQPSESISILVKSSATNLPKKVWTEPSKTLSTAGNTATSPFPSVSPKWPGGVVVKPTLKLTVNPTPTANATQKLTATPAPKTAEPLETPVVSASTAPSVTATAMPSTSPTPTPTPTPVPLTMTFKDQLKADTLIAISSPKLDVGATIEGKGNLTLTYSIQQDDGSGKINRILSDTMVPLTWKAVEYDKVIAEVKFPGIALVPDVNIIRFDLMDGEGKTLSKTLKILRKVDTDSDGLLDYYERQKKTSVTNPDTDADGLMDGEEVNMYASNPFQKDTDGDGLLDSYEAKELRFLADPIDSTTVSSGLKDGEADNDGDWLSNLQEQRLGTDPLEQDTDQDGIPDGTEVIEYSTNPLEKDSDTNGIPDRQQVFEKIKTDAYEALEQSVFDEVYQEYAKNKQLLPLQKAVQVLDIWRSKTIRKDGEALLKMPSLEKSNVKTISDSAFLAFIRLFQRVNGLPVNGILDVKTTEVLIQPETWKREESLGEETKVSRGSFGAESYIKIGTVSNNFPLTYYSQNRGEWSTYPYYPIKRNVPQNGRVITKNGCGPTAMAMIVATLKDKTVTPKIMADFSMDNDGINENYDTLGSLYPKVANAYGLTCKWVANISDVVAALKTGKYIALASMGVGHFTGGGHLLALMGVETVYDKNDERILVYDSNSGNDSYFRYGKDGKIILTNNMGQVLSKPDIFDKEKALGFWIFDKK